MLRNHNKHIPVRLTVIKDEGVCTKSTNHRGDQLHDQYHPQDYLKLIDNLGVEIYYQEPISEFFHVHRSLLKKEDSLLFIDADTFIFGDVEVLFEKYKNYDYVGLPIAKLPGWRDWLPFRPYNSAVNLWNNGWIGEFIKVLPEYCDAIFRKEHVVSEWCYSQCSRATNREEMATSLFVADRKLKHTAWELTDVRNSATLVDYDEAPRSIVFHTFTHNWEMAMNLFCRGKKIIFKRRRK